MIDREHGLPVSKQANTLNVSRGNVYYAPRPVLRRDLRLMRRIDGLHMDYPFAGSLIMQEFQNQESFGVSRKHTATLMRKMGIEALYRRPRTTRPGPGHKVYPYLLKGMTAGRPNQVWATDICYIPMTRGSVYLCAVIDWFTQRMLSWRLSISMETAFYIEALKEALEQYGAPAVFSTDRGSQFTAEAFTGVLRSHGIQISMDGKAAWRDNVLSKDFGGRSSTRRFISGPAPRSPRRGKAWPGTSTSTMQGGRTRRLTECPRIRLTSTHGSFRLPYIQTWGLHLRDRENCSDKRDQFSGSQIP